MRPLPALAALALLAACNRPSTADAPPAPAAPAGAAGAPGKTGAAAIRGTVRWRGPPPDERPAPLTFPECKARKAVPAVKVAGDRLANAFVWVKEGLPPGDYPVPAAPVVLDQRDCEYSPHVFGIRPGQPLQMVNSDPMLHNVHARGLGAGPGTGPNAFNVAMPIQGSKLSRRFDDPQVAVTITCDVHPWMRAYAGVVPHPFWAVSGDDGAFAIQGLPAGTYVVEAWHERLGRRTARLTVAEGATATADLEFAP